MKDVTASAIVSKRRIIAGEANEVYDIRTSDERDLIVRISRDREKDFEQERWAIDQCTKTDVPVPTILAIKHFSEGTNPIDICIQDKLAGDLLSIAAASLPRDRVKGICVRVGELLARVHGIRTKGHGYLNRQGEGQFRFTSDTLGREEERYLALAKRTGFEETAMRAILTFLFELWRTPPVDPRMIHNDFRAKHVMVRDGCVAGIIDWGEVASGSPINDFAEWDYWDGTTVPLEWLLEGYAYNKLVAAEFDTQLHLKRLEYGVCVLWWYQHRGFAFGVEEAKRKLYRDLAFFTGSTA